MHFLTVVLLPQDVALDEDAVYEALERVLLPCYFEMEPEAPMRKEYYDAHTIKNIATRYCVRPSNVQKIAAELRKDLGTDCGVDEQGLYYITNLNPNGKLDYWTLHNIATDVWRARVKPLDLLLSAVVTPDGQWHDVGVEKYDRDLTARDRQAISQRAHALIDQYPDCWAVALDCHT